MLVATFNATTGWTGRQITWQDERFILDGHGAITAADVMEYDRRGHLDWPSEEMRSWAAARLAWEHAVAASASPVVETPAAVTPSAAGQASPGASSAPVAGEAASLPATAAAEQATEPEQAATTAADEAPTQGTVFGGSAAEQPVAAAAAAFGPADEPIITPQTTQLIVASADDGPIVTPEVLEPAATAPAEPAESPAAEPAAQPTVDVRDVLVPGGDILEVVGTASHQEGLAIVAGGGADSVGDVEKWAHLIPEPDNPWDRNAVAVYIDGRKVGYLPRESAGAYAALLGQLWAGSRSRAVCRAVISGGWRQLQSQVGTVTSVDEPQLGVRLALAAPQRFDVTQELRSLSAEELAAGPPPV